MVCTSILFPSPPFPPFITAHPFKEGVWICHLKKTKGKKGAGWLHYDVCFLPHMEPPKKHHHHLCLHTENDQQCTKVRTGDENNFNRTHIHELADYEPPNLTEFTEPGLAGRISHAIAVGPHAEALNPPIPIPDGIAALDVVFAVVFFILFLFLSSDLQTTRFYMSLQSVPQSVLCL
jgi:hypothetical protein